MTKLIEEEAMVSNQEIMSSDYTSDQSLNNWFAAFFFFLISGRLHFRQGLYIKWADYRVVVLAIMPFENSTR